MTGKRSSFRTSLAWLKSRLAGEQGPPPAGERRSNLRKRMRFEAEIQKLDGTIPVIGVDIHEDGARILSKKAWDTGTVLFLKLPDVQLGGFAEVRHCTPRKDGRYTIGLAFRGPLIPQGSEWQVQRICQPPTDAWTSLDDVPAVSDSDHLPVRKPREVA
jgi:hypothetical protein